MKKAWTMTIRRWNDEKMRFVEEVKKVTEIELDYDAKESEKIESIHVYTALRVVSIYITLVRP